MNQREKETLLAFLSTKLPSVFVFADDGNVVFQHALILAACRRILDSQRIYNIKTPILNDGIKKAIAENINETGVKEYKALLEATAVIVDSYVAAQN